MESIISTIVGITLIGGTLYIVEKISAKNEKIKSLEREHKQLVEDFEKRRKKKEKKKIKKQARKLEELSSLDKLERYQKKRKKREKK